MGNETPSQNCIEGEKFARRKTVQKSFVNIPKSEFGFIFMSEILKRSVRPTPSIPCPAQDVVVSI